MPYTAPQNVTEFAPAKINLNLHVTGKRDDGYHTIKSLVCFAKDVGDIIKIAPCDDFRLTINGPFADALNAEADNIITKAAAFFLHHTKTATNNFEVTLTKNLPIAAGIGGGSSDAAATLKALCEYFKQSKEQLQHLTQKSIALGADVPICMRGNAAIIKNIGEIIEPLNAPLPECYAVLINPNQPCSTHDIFQNLNKKDHHIETIKPPSFDSYETLITYLNNSKNTLKPIAIQNVSIIQSILKKLDTISDCDYSQMSGSGATCFGIFKTYDHTESAVKQIRQDHPEWWVSPVTTLI